MGFAEKFEMVLGDISASQVESFIASELGLDKKGGKYRCIWHNHKNPYKVTFFEEGKCFKCHDTEDTQVNYGLRNLLMEHKGMTAGETLTFMDQHFLGGKYTSAKGDKTASTKKVEVKKEVTQEDKNKQQSYMAKIQAVLNDNSKSNGIAWLKEERGIQAKIEHNIPIAQIGSTIYYLYKNLAGDVVNVKVRHEGKRFESFKAADTFLPFNFENCKDYDKALYIAEGEQDCIALHTLGYQSITMGSSGSIQVLKDNYNEISKFKTLIVAMDNDRAGEVAETKIKELFPAALTIDKSYYYGLNDINDILKERGEGAVRKTVETGIHMGENVVCAKDVTTTREIGKKVKTIFEDLNGFIGGWRKGTINVISGGSGSGKTTFVNQAVILSHLLAGEKVFWYNAEFKNDIGLKNFLNCVTSREDDIIMDVKGVVRGKVRHEFSMKEESFSRLKKCIGDNLYIYKDSTLNDPVTVFTEIEKYARVTGVKTIVIDNLMCLKNRDIDDDNRAVTVLMMKLKELANELGIAIFIVAHTKKGQKGIESQESIAGTSNVGNLADTVMIISRNLQDDEMINYYISKNQTTIPPSKEGPILNSMKVIIDKNRYDGDIGKIEFVYDKKTRRYDTGSGVVRSTDYEKELLSLQVKQVKVRQEARVFENIDIPEDVF